MNIRLCQGTIQPVPQLFICPYNHSIICSGLFAKTHLRDYSWGPCHLRVFWTPYRVSPATSTLQTVFCLRENAVKMRELICGALVEYLIELYHRFSIKWFMEWNCCSVGVATPRAGRDCTLIHWQGVKSYRLLILDFRSHRVTVREPHFKWKNICSWFNSNKCQTSSDDWLVSE